MERIPVGIIGATGMVGQRLITLLEHHPWFEVRVISASPRSKGLAYGEAIKTRWSQIEAIPDKVAGLILTDSEDVNAFLGKVALVFAAFSADKPYTRHLEERFASNGIPVISNNSAHRWTQDIPMVIPEINPHHFDLIKAQQKHRGWNEGFIVVKPNCSIQSYVPVLHAWSEFEPVKVIVSTYQAVSGAGKTLETWPQMDDNVIPFISGEEMKSEREPLKIFGKISNGVIHNASHPVISAHCIRVPISDGHLTSINVSFTEHPEKATLIEAIRTFENPLRKMELPSAPEPFMIYHDKEDRPQTRLDRGFGGGMGVSIGRLRADTILDWKFVALSHNTIRGAAGGSILNAEYLVKNGFINNVQV